FERWGLQGHPSLVLADPQGRAYADLRDGRVPDQAEAYVKLMTQLQAQRRQRDALIAQAAAAEGPQKAKLLDEALRGVPERFVQSDYGDVVGQIVQLTAGVPGALRDKYTALELGRRQSAVRSAMASPKCDWGGTLKQIEEIIDGLKPGGKE